MALIPFLFDFINCESNILTKVKKIESPVIGLDITNLVNEELKKFSNDYKIVRITYEDNYFKRSVDLTECDFFNDPTTFKITVEKITNTNSSNSEKILDNFQPCQSIENSDFTFEQNTIRQHKKQADHRIELEDDSAVDIIQNLSKKVKNGFPVPEKNSPEFVLWRQRIISAIGVYLVMNSPDNNPKKEDRIKFARGLIKVFPELKALSSLYGYEHIYDPNTGLGFLTTYIKNKSSRDILITTRPYNKKPKNLQNINDLENHDELELQKNAKQLIELMKFKDINTQNDKQDIINAMISTQAYRQNLIKANSPSLTEILEIFPKFKKLPFMINEDYMALSNEFKTNSNNFLMRWSSLYVDKIIKYAQKSKSNQIKEIISSLNDSTNDNKKSIIAFTIVSTILGNLNPRGKKNKLAANQTKNFFFREFKSGTSQIEMIEEANKLTTQPILILLDNGQIFLKLDSELINTDSSFTTSFDLLFKSFWVFNIKYENSAAFVYYFFETFYGIEKNKKPSISEFLAVIESQ